MRPEKKTSEIFKPEPGIVARADSRFSDSYRPFGQKALRPFIAFLSADGSDSCDGAMNAAMLFHEMSSKDFSRLLGPFDRTVLESDGRSKVYLLETPGFLLEISSGRFENRFLWRRKSDGDRESLAELSADERSEIRRAWRNIAARLCLTDPEARAWIGPDFADPLLAEAAKLEAQRIGGIAPSPAPSPRSRPSRSL